jgi:N-formylglutamate deformylase
MIEIERGQGPIVLGLPHTGIVMPEEVARGLNGTGLARADTDWHIHRLYKGLLDDVTTVRTVIHRYAIDVNRGPDDESLYPGQNTTGLCPLTDFDGHPIYRPGAEPDAGEVERRREVFHSPYHDALSTELSRIHKIHGHAILYDCHSIRSVIPYLFADTLPDFNIGTNSSTSCTAIVEKTVNQICTDAPGFTRALNGRFKGGWTTRHYGDPARGIHAIQMELAQSTYMIEHPPWTWDDRGAGQVREQLSRILNALRDLSRNGALQ